MKTLRHPDPERSEGEGSHEILRPSGTQNDANVLNKIKL